MGLQGTGGRELGPKRQQGLYHGRKAKSDVEGTESMEVFLATTPTWVDYATTNNTDGCGYTAPPVTIGVPVPPPPPPNEGVTWGSPPSLEYNDLVARFPHPRKPCPTWLAIKAYFRMLMRHWWFWSI